MSDDIFEDYRKRNERGVGSTDEMKAHYKVCASALLKREKNAEKIANTIKQLMRRDH